MTDEHEPKQVVFRVYGITADDLPDDVHDMSKAGYPKDGCDHEAHHAATAVFNALKAQEYEWSDDITGVSLGWQ
jgi:hypothetical protein